LPVAAVDHDGQGSALGVVSLRGRAGRTLRGSKALGAAGLRSDKQQSLSSQPAAKG